MYARNSKLSTQSYASESKHIESRSCYVFLNDKIDQDFDTMLVKQKNHPKLLADLQSFLDHDVMKMNSEELNCIKNIFTEYVGPIDEFIQKQGPKLKLCSICQQVRDKSGGKLIQCSTCRTYFHTLCLDPPIEKGIPRGYVWHCTDCDSSGDDDSLSET